MIPDYDQIHGLIARPGESLNVEVKRWLDPSETNGIAKIVKATFAIRNRNGGFIVVGFDDKTLEPDIEHEPRDVRAVFHQDKMQLLISRYAHEPFEIHVAFGERDGRKYPVIVVPEGVQVPVVAKANLSDATGSKLISQGEVYFRSLHPNGTPSSAVARPEDWRDILQICFDNREADIGRFLRRQLAGQDLSKFVEEIKKRGGPSESSISTFVVANAQAADVTTTLRGRCAALLTLGEQRFTSAIKERGLSTSEMSFVEKLQWHVGLAVEPPMSNAIADREFFAKFASNNPNYTGWPVWLDARTLSDKRDRPVVRSGAWEALIVRITAEIASRLEFFRLDPKGDFYLRRLLQDDAVPSRVEPGERLDPILVIIRVAEAIAVGLSVAKGLGWSQETTRLGFMCRWRKLKGRRLDSWSNPIVYVPGGGTAEDDAVTTFVEVPLDTPASAIAAFVDDATRDLFVLFDGTRLPASTVEEWTRRLIERRLNS
jgi:Putative DNA-binding domain